MTVQIQQTTALAEQAAANSQSWEVGWGKQPGEDGAQLAKQLGHGIRHCSCKPGKRNGLQGTVQPLISLQVYLLPVPDRGQWGQAALCNCSLAGPEPPLKQENLQKGKACHQKAPRDPFVMTWTGQVMKQANRAVCLTALSLSVCLFVLALSFEQWPGLPGKQNVNILAPGNYKPSSEF